MQTELDILKDVTTKLDNVGVKYMLTGSLAMAYYAQPRMTRDIDLVIELIKLQVEDFVKAFGKEYYVSRDSIIDSIEEPFMFNLIHLNSSIKVDCIVRKPGEYRKIEFNRRKKVTFSGTGLFIVSKEDLILSKLLWAKESDSELQKRDIKSLLASDYDKEYVFAWAKKLNLYDFFMSIIK